jgi:hypothetical protein
MLLINILKHFTAFVSLFFGRPTHIDFLRSKKFYTAEKIQGNPTHNCKFFQSWRFLSGTANVIARPGRQKT